VSLRSWRSLGSSMGTPDEFGVNVTSMQVHITPSLKKSSNVLRPQKAKRNNRAIYAWLYAGAIVMCRFTQVYDSCVL
jgi:hypothetical protein